MDKIKLINPDNTYETGIITKSSAYVWCTPRIPGGFRRARRHNLVYTREVEPKTFNLLCWKPPVFIPTDPCLVALWAHKDGLDDLAAIKRIEHEWQPAMTARIGSELDVVNTTNHRPA